MARALILLTMGLMAWALPAQALTPREFRGWTYAVHDLHLPVTRHSKKIAGFEEKLIQINRQINGVDYVPDDLLFADKGHWETPSEFYLSGGMCRDYVVAKYYALRELGVADQDLEFTAVIIARTGELHAVLVVNYEGRKYVLDNRRADVAAEAEGLRGYRLVYALNRLHVRDYRGKFAQGDATEAIFISVR